MKKPKNKGQFHTAKTKYGMGDYYGMGVRNAVGTIERSYMEPAPVKGKSIGKAPKSLA
jgi:hypothetical protein